MSTQPFPADRPTGRIFDLLDLRVLGDGSIAVASRWDFDGSQGTADTTDGDYGAVTRFDPNGTVRPLSVDDPQLSATFSIPDVCEAPGGRAGYLDAARIRPDGTAVALWDCIDFKRPGETNNSKVVDRDATKVVVTVESRQDYANRFLPQAFGEDLELASDGTVYALVAEGTSAPPLSSQRGPRRTGRSIVYKLAPFDGEVHDPEVTPSVPLPGLPVDLAIDSSNRPLAWTENGSAASTNTWDIRRLKAGDLTVDTSWGTKGRAAITSPLLGHAFSRAGLAAKDTFLVPRPTAGPLVLGPGANKPGPGSAPVSSEAVLASLTDAGGLDTAYGSGGFRSFTGYDNNGVRIQRLKRVGEPALQRDGKTLVPTTSSVIGSDEPAPPGTPDPSELGDYVGVTRLLP